MTSSGEALPLAASTQTRVAAMASAPASADSRWLACQPLRLKGQR